MVSPPTLWAAAKNNDVAELERLLAEGVDIDARDARGHSALMLATYHGQREAFALLLARGADPNTHDESSNSALMGAAFKGHLDLLRALLRAGADARAVNYGGMNARDFALMFDRAEAAELLATWLSGSADR
jgi:ankyrin repeat protein